MSDAPERIVASREPYLNRWEASFVIQQHKPKPPLRVEYVRADLYAALEQERDALQKARRLDARDVLAYEPQLPVALLEKLRALKEGDDE